MQINCQSAPVPVRCEDDLVDQAFEAGAEARRARLTFHLPALRLFGGEPVTFATMLEAERIALRIERRALPRLPSFDVSNVAAQLARHALLQLARDMPDRWQCIGIAEAFAYILGFDIRPACDGINLALQVDGDDPAPITTCEKIAILGQRMLEGLRAI